MEKVVRIFNSFQERDEANRRYYASLDPQERLDIFLTLLENWRAGQDEPAQEFKRVYRIVKLDRR